MKWCGLIVVVLMLQSTFVWAFEELQIKEGVRVPVWSITGLNMQKFEDEWGKDPVNSPLMGYLEPGKKYLVLGEQQDSIFTFKDGDSGEPSSKKETFISVHYNDNLYWINKSELGGIQQRQKGPAYCPPKKGLQQNAKEILAAAVPDTKIAGVKSEEEFKKYFGKYLCDKKTKGKSGRIACRRYEMYNLVVQNASKHFDIPYSALACLVTRESRWNWNADKHKNKKKAHLYAWGMAQIKPIAGADTAQVLIPNYSTKKQQSCESQRRGWGSCRNLFLQERWDHFIGSFKGLTAEDMPYIESTQNYVNLAAIKREAEKFKGKLAKKAKKVEVLNSVDYLANNAPTNLGIAALRLRVNLWDFGMYKDEKLSAEQLIMAMGAYNRGLGAFKKKCKGLSLNACLKVTRKACQDHYKNNPKNKKNHGWYEGHRYMMSIKNCMEKGNMQSIDLPKGKCP